MQPRSDAGGEIHGLDSDRLVVPNDLSQLARVSDWVRRFAHEHRLAHQLAFGLELSVNEALTNIMSYAYCDDARHEILVELFARPDRVHVEIEDDGVAFNPLDLPIEEPAESLEKSRPAGRGIPLMRNIMDELHYTRRGNRNALTMVMHYARI